MSSFRPKLVHFLQAPRNAIPIIARLFEITLARSERPPFGVVEVFFLALNFRVNVSPRVCKYAAGVDRAEK